MRAAIRRSGGGSNALPLIRDGESARAERDHLFEFAIGKRGSSGRFFPQPPAERAWVDSGTRRDGHSTGSSQGRRRMVRRTPQWDRRVMGAPRSERHGRVHARRCEASTREPFSRSEGTRSPKSANTAFRVRTTPPARSLRSRSTSPTSRRSVEEEWRQCRESRTSTSTPSGTMPTSRYGGRDARGPPRFQPSIARRAGRPRSTTNRATPTAEENRPYARRDALGNASRTTDGERVGGPSAGETPAVPALPAFDRTAGETPAVHHQPRDACGIPTASARLHPLRRLDAE